MSILESYGNGWEGVMVLFFPTADGPAYLREFPLHSKGTSKSAANV